MIATIAEKKFSDCSDHMEITLDFSSISAIVAIAAIIWKPLSSDRGDHSDRSDSNNTRMHCVADSKILRKLLLLEDLSNPISLSFPSSFTLKSTHKYKKPTFKQESTMARTMCQTQVPSDFIHFLSDRSDRSDHMETSLYMIFPPFLYFDSRIHKRQLIEYNSIVNKNVLFY